MFMKIHVALQNDSVKTQNIGETYANRGDSTRLSSRSSGKVMPGRVHGAPKTPI
jgi:hypothetical protein